MVNHSKHRCVSEPNVQLFQWCERIVAYRLQDQLFSGFFDAKVVMVDLL